MKKKRLFLPLFLLLSSCDAPVREYRRYFSTMTVPSFALPFGAIDEREMINRYDEEGTDAFFCNLYILRSSRDVREFLQVPGLSYTAEDEKRLEDLSGDQMALLCLYQVPPFYAPYLRYSIQTMDEEGNLIAVTDNFFSLAPRPEINYLFLDLIPSQRETAMVSSALYVFDESRGENLDPDTIRVFLSIYN